VLHNSSFTNNGTFDGGSGKVKIMGDAPDENTTIRGTRVTTFHELVISKSANNVLLGQDANVSQQLTLEGGQLDVQELDLTLGDNARLVQGADADRYVKTSGSGQLKMNVDGKIFFPVGNSSFNPVTLVNDGTLDEIGLRVEDQALSNLTSGTAATVSTVNRVWHVTEAVEGGSDLSLSLQWTDSDELTDFDRTEATLAQYDGSDWQIKNTGRANGENPYLFGSSGILEVGAFAIGNIVCDLLDGSALLGIESPSLASILPVDIGCQSSVQLMAEEPTLGTGQWSILDEGDGMGEFSFLGDDFDPTLSPSVSFSGTLNEIYTLQWTVTNQGVCRSSDMIEIEFNPDSDGDSVRDCEDVCPEGDDTVNSDGVGMPDDCDCRMNDAADEFIFVNQSLITQPHDTDPVSFIEIVADFQINSDAVISDTDPDIVFQAGNNIVLEPGFSAKAGQFFGSTFTARIAPCRDPEMAAEVAFREEDKQILAPDVFDVRLQPNLVYDETNIFLELSHTQTITLQLFDQSGRLVRTFLSNQEQPAGTTQYLLRTDNLQAGMYLLRLQGSKEIVTKKMVVVK